MVVKKVERQSRSTQAGPALASPLRARCVLAAGSLRARCVTAASPLRARCVHEASASSNLRLGILQSPPRHPSIYIQSLDSHYLILILKHRIHRNQRFIIIIQAIIITCSIESITFAHIQLNLIYYYIVSFK